MKLNLITEAGDISGKTVIVRASCNVPLVDGVVRNAFRLRRALPTLKYLKDSGAKVIVISHLGRETTDTLRPVYDELGKDLPLIWGGTIGTPEFEAALDSAEMGDIVFCENLRQDSREEDNDESFAKLVASYADIYVNDAFAEAHREHASTYGLARVLPAFAGITLAEEVYKLQEAMTPQRPALFLLGGAKFETKMPLVEKYLTLYDYVFVGGALAHDVLKARGFEIGQSLVSDVSLKDVSFLWSEKLLVPIDVVVESVRGVETKSVEAVLPDEKIFDLGPATVDMLARYISEAKTVLWNGPFGNYEAGFEEGTEDVAKLVAESDAYSVIGGGDTVAAVEKLGLNENFSFVSIGGGSMLTFMELGTTAVLETLKK